MDGMPGESGGKGGEETEPGKEKALGVETGLGSTSKLVVNAPALGGVNPRESVDGGDGKSSAEASFAGEPLDFGSRSNAFMLSGLEVLLLTLLPPPGLAI